MERALRGESSPLKVSHILHGLWPSCQLPDPEAWGSEGYLKSVCLTQGRTTVNMVQVLRAQFHMRLCHKEPHCYTLDPEPQRCDFCLGSYHPLVSQGCQTTLLRLGGQENTPLPCQNEPSRRILVKEVQSKTGAPQALFLTPTAIPNRTDDIRSFPKQTRGSHLWKSRIPLDHSMLLILPGMRSSTFWNSQRRGCTDFDPNQSPGTEGTATRSFSSPQLWQWHLVAASKKTPKGREIVPGCHWPA